MRIECLGEEHILDPMGTEQEGMDSPDFPTLLVGIRALIAMCGRMLVVMLLVVVSGGEVAKFQRAERDPRPDEVARDISLARLVP